MLNAFPIFWRRRRARLAASFLWLGAMFTVACGGNPPGGKSSSVDDTRPPQADLLARDILTRDIDETRLVTLQGNTRPEAKPENDLGPVDDGLVVNGVLLQLKRSDAQEHQLTELIDELHKRDSTRFHQWLTAAEFGDQFGTSQADLDKITGWLRSHGLRVDGVQTSGMLIDFSGTAQQ